MRPPPPRRAPPALGLGFASFVLLIGCADVTPAYRYRLTVEVDTPRGPRTGSGVVEVRTSATGSDAVPLPKAVGVAVRGEAVPVALPDGRTLFALLSGPSHADWAGWIMVHTTRVPERWSEDSFQQRFQAMLADRGVKALPRTWRRGYGSGPGEEDAYPWLVRFDDPADPATGRAVDPDQLSAAFGPGYELRRITVRLTDDAVTSGLQKHLPWVAEHVGGLDGTGSMYDHRRTPEKNLTRRDFIQDGAR